jgi:hypothetical protein
VGLDWRVEELVGVAVAGGQAHAVTGAGSEPVEENPPAS